MRRWIPFVFAILASGCLEVQIRSLPEETPTDDAPALRLEADRAAIDAGESVFLTWSGQGLTDCRAEGGWQGPRLPAGGQWVGPLQEDTVFRLRCETTTGETVSAETRVIVTPPEQPRLTGTVDGYWLTGSQPVWVYAFPAGIAADDRDGVDDPLATAPVEETAPCRYGFRLDLPAGDYTLALVRGADDPTIDGDAEVRGSWPVAVAATGAQVDLPAPNVVRVGPGGDYATLAEAARAVADGTVVEIAAGDYVDDVAVWRQKGLVLRGVGGNVRVRAENEIGYEPGNDQANGKGIFVLRGEDIRIEHLELSGARVPDRNGAGIRIDPVARRITLCDVAIHDNENGLLGTANDLRIEHSRFYDNGIQGADELGISITHNLYVTDGTRLVFFASESLRARTGHNLKSRARRNEVLYSVLADEATGTASYAADFPNGGEVLILGSVLHKGPRSENEALLAYGVEGLADDGRDHTLTLVHDTLVSRNGFGGEIFLAMAAGTRLLRLYNNLFLGPAQRLAGGAEQVEAQGNVDGEDADVADADAFDFRPVVGSRALDAGIDLVGLDLPRPRWEPRRPAGLAPREVRGAGWDAGAYEGP